MAQRITVDAPNKVRYVIEGPDDITDDEIYAHVERAMEEDAKHTERTGVLPHAAQALTQGRANMYELSLIHI